LVDQKEPTSSPFVEVESYQNNKGPVSRALAINYDWLNQIYQSLPVGVDGRSDGSL